MVDNLRSSADESAVEKSLAELRQYISGSKPVPVPTYFLGAAGSAADKLLQLLDDPENQADVHYLGKSGLTELKGLSVAFLDLEHTQVPCFRSNIRPCAI